jgi:hypothetical protein
MSDPKLVTDKAPKFIHGIQKHVVEADSLPVTIPSGSQLALVGSIENKGSLTINGRLYITQELGI